MPKGQEERRGGVLSGTLRDELKAVVREHFQIEQGLKEVAVYSIRAGVIPLPAGWPDTPVLILKKQDIVGRINTE